MDATRKGKNNTVTPIADFILAGILIWGLCSVTGISKIDLDIGQVILILFTWMICVFGIQYLFDHVPELFEKKTHEDAE